MAGTADTDVLYRFYWRRGGVARIPDHFVSSCEIHSTQFLREKINPILCSENTSSCKRECSRQLITDK